MSTSVVETNGTTTILRQPAIGLEERFEPQVAASPAVPTTILGRESWLDRMLFKQLTRRLNGIVGGRLTLHYRGQTFHFGDHTAELSADWTINDPGLLRRLLLGDSLGVAESYIQGEWTTKNLPNLLTVLCRNLSHLKRYENSIWARPSHLLARVAHCFARNTHNGSHKNIEAHYDLSNEFFALFLDPTMMYSAANYDRSEMTLEQASVAKLDRVCRKLDLQAEDRVIEIGSGWGGLALHAVKNSGCHVTTTTISKQQFELATDRFEEHGVEDRIELLATDYRELTGQYDKLVSIEMIEAVGERYLDSYFHTCNRLLKPGGRMVIQAITMPENRFARYRKGVDFIQKYVFPGSFIPSVSRMQQAVGRSTDLRLVSAEDFADDYARTLRDWRREFFNNIDAVRELGFDDYFIRMWDYYLCYCEAGFSERAIGLVQFVWDKPLHTG
jgi:cyclopropane-fatty-acyl-phospholipid synthase